MEEKDNNQTSCAHIVVKNINLSLLDKKCH